MDKNTQHPYFAGTRHPRVLAHRGLVTRELAARGIAENSLAAITAAVDAGVEYVESDCHVTSDGAVVLFHDDNLRRVAGDRRAIADVTLSELASLMSERGGLATLEHALQAFPETRFNIDIKAAGTADSAGMTIAPHAQRVLITSFSDARRRRALRAARTVARAMRPATSPGRAALIRVLLAVTTRSRVLANRALAGLDALQIPEKQGPVRVLTPRLIDAAHRAGVEVHVWTINDVDRMQQLVQLGVDGIVTDRADEAIRALHS